MFQEDLFDRFRQKALLAAPKLRVAPDRVNECVAVLMNSLGEAWIRAKAEEMSKAIPMPLLRHPVGGMIQTAGPNQIAEALELAEYLKAVARSPEFPTVVAGLKAQFRSTRLQLAFAFRFSALSQEAPVLEPPALDGRLGDIAFQVNGRRYLAECYAPGKRSGKLDEVEWLTSKAVKLIEGRPNTFSIAIQLHTVPTAKERKKLQQVLEALVESTDREPWNGLGYPPSRLHVDEIATVSVARTRVSEPGRPANLALHPDFPSLGEPHRFIAVKQVPLSMVRALESDTLGEPYRDHVAIWVPDGHYGLPEVVDQKVLDLLPKMKSKLAQTKSPGCHRILVVDTWTAGKSFSLSDGALSELRHELFDQHRDVAGIAMVKRSYSENIIRYRYDIRAIPNDAVDDSLVTELAERETRLLVPPSEN